MKKLLCTLALAMLASGCDTDRVTSPQVSGGVGVRDEVEVPIEVGSASISIMYQGQLMSYATTGCGSFAFDLKNTATNQSYSVFMNCGSFAPTAPTVVRDLPPGPYTLRMAYGTFTPMLGVPPIILGTQDFTVSTGVATPVTFDVSDQVGQVRGRVLVNGAPPSTPDYNVSLTSNARADINAFTQVQWTMNPPPVIEPGLFRFLFPAGASTGQVRTMLGSALRTFTADVTIGETTDVGDLESGTGSASISIMYQGQLMSYATTGCGSFAFDLKNTATNQSYSVFMNCGSFAPTAPIIARDLPPGPYTLRLAYGNFTPMPGVSPVILGTQSFTVTGGVATPVTFDVSDQVGQVRGRVLINGQPPTSPDYNVSLTSNARADINAFTQVQWTMNPPPVIEPGLFRFLFPAGASTGQVRTMMGSGLRTFTADVTIGETTDVGDLESGTGSASISIMYQGQLMSYATTGCGSFAFDLKNTATNQSYSVFMNCGSFAPTAPIIARDLPPGPYTLRLAYGNFTPMPGVSPVILGTQSFTVSGGVATPVTFDVSDQVGQVRGLVLINGQPPTSPDYNVSLRSDARADINAFTQVQWSMNPPPVTAPGSFAFLFPGGPATGQVRSMLGNLLATFHVNVQAGTVIDIGNPVDPGPTANAGGPYSGTEGAAIAFDGRASSGATSYAWNFGDGTPVVSGAQPTHVYSDNGTFNVTLTVTSASGATATTQAIVTVQNAAPVIAMPPAQTILQGDIYTATGSFTDAGAADTWSAMVNFGDGAIPLTLNANTFTISRTLAPGTYQVAVTITDDDGGSTTGTTTVIVRSLGDAMRDLLALINALVPAGEAKSLTPTVEAAIAQFDRGNTGAAKNQLGAFINKLESNRGGGAIPPDVAQRLISEAMVIVGKL